MIWLWQLDGLLPQYFRVSGGAGQSFGHFLDIDSETDRPANRPYNGTRDLIFVCFFHHLLTLKLTLDFLL